MSLESDFIARLRSFATDDAARGLMDDTALFGDLVLTHDMIVAGVHFLPDDPPQDVAWKLVAVNLSDLAAKGAVPLGILLGAGLTDDAGWNAGFTDGLRDASVHFGVPLLGGDTVKMPAGSVVTLGLTAIGRASGTVPSRSGARPGDGVYVAGVIGDAGLGLHILQSGAEGPASLIAAYRRPLPLLETGRMLAGAVTAMMDVSDGLLIDASRMAVASDVAIMIDLDAVPLSSDAIAYAGSDRAARLSAATAGDDYALLFTSTLPLPPGPSRITRIGKVTRGSGLILTDGDGDVPQPVSLGWEHD
jgi:thiamine-monophosphate kinase